MKYSLRTRMPLAIAALAAAMAAGLASAQSINITSVTPASGNFPTSGAGVVIAFDYNLAGTPDGQVAAFLQASPAPGPGQTGLAPSFSPVWLTAAQTSGHAQISLVGYCQDASTVPAGTVSEVSVVLSKSGHFSGPIGPQLAKDTKPVNFAYACPGAAPAGTNQGRGRPDITSKKGITIGGDVGGAGGKSSAWGGQINLVPADTKLPVGNGKCAFNVTYDVTNAGTAATGPSFRNDLKEDGTLVAQTGIGPLSAGQTTLVKTQAYLSPGTHVLSVYLDNGGAAPNHEVSESNESNNTFSVKYTLDASCKPTLAKSPLTAPPRIVVPTPTPAAIR